MMHMQSAQQRDMHRAALEGRPVSPETALEILQCGAREIPDILSCATEMRRRRFGDRLHFCSIMNAKSGACSEDCSFCAQSVHHHTEARVAGLAPMEEMIASYEAASRCPIDHFGLVTSGKAVSQGDLDILCKIPGMGANGRVGWCASLGCLGLEALRALKASGFKRFHHNLETARSFFPQVCTTHSYDQRIETVRLAAEAGLEVCCGGILGLGETDEQRVEFAATLAQEKVCAIPLNFLIPIEGTRQETMPVMKPLEMIRSIAMFRMMNPLAEIKVCAGRVNLRDLQSMLFYAGATGMMIGPLLTVAGREVEQDLQMLNDLEVLDGTS